MLGWLLLLLLLLPAPALPAVLAAVLPFAGAAVLLEAAAC
jgi:hypothetical protein